MIEIKWVLIVQSSAALWKSCNRALLEARKPAPSRPRRSRFWGDCDRLVRRFEHSLLSPEHREQRSALVDVYYADLRGLDMEGMCSTHPVVFFARAAIDGHVHASYEEVLVDWCIEVGSNCCSILPHLARLQCSDAKDPG